MASSPEQRELSLLSNVEMRIALADSDEKLQSLLDKYLPPVLLKLNSQSEPVRAKVFAICQHVNTRIQPTQISLPVSKLVEQFKNVDNSAVLKQFDLVYIRMGLQRMSPVEQRAVFPTLLDGIAELESSPGSAAVIFNLVLKLLDKQPTANPGDLDMRAKLGITPETARFLAKWLEKLLLFIPGGTDAKSCPGLSEAEYTFINVGESPAQIWNPNAEGGFGGLNLTKTKMMVLHFLAGGAFLDSERTIPTAIASADSNNNISDLADDALRRFQPDFENSDVVDQLFTLYLGKKTPAVVPPVRASVRTKILAILCKSATATTKIDQIDQLIDDGLLSRDSLAEEGLQATKLRNQIFSFMTWFARTGSRNDLNRIAQKTIDGLMAFISSQGWPSPSRRLSMAESDLRNLAYETIGIVIPTSDQFSTDGNVQLYSHLTQWLFTSLSCDDSHSQISVGIEKTLGTLLNSISGNTNKGLLEEVGQILLRQVNYNRGQQEALTGHATVRSTKFSAVRFANGCLPFNDVKGRWVALLASGDEAPETAEEGRKGLDPYWYGKLNPQKLSPMAASDQSQVDNSRYTFPRFYDLAEYLFGPDGMNESTDSPSMDKLLSKPYFPIYRKVITFLRNILLTEALEPTRTALDAGDSDWEHRLDTVLSTDETARETLRNFIEAYEPAPLLTFMNAAAQGAILHDLDPGSTLTHFVELVPLVRNSLLVNLLPIASSICAAMRRNPFLDQRTAARIIGILGSHPDSAYSPSYSIREITDVATASVLTATGQAIKQACGTILARGYWLSRMSFRRRIDDALMTDVKEYLSSLIPILETTKHSNLRDVTLLVISQLGLAGLVSSSTLPADYDLAKLSQIIMAKDAKYDKELAVQTWGCVSSAAYRLDVQIPEAERFELLTKPLFDLYDVRDIEVQFAIGEALSVISAGWKSKSLITAFDVDSEWPESKVAPEIIALVLEKVLEACKSPKPSQKKAAIIWLLSVVRYCGENGEVQGSLRKCQVAFLRLLSDRDEIVQDSASRGLSLVYEMGNQEFKDDLVRDLVQFFTADGSKLSGGSVMVGTELFEPGELPTGDGSSVRTYKDIVNLASELGNPSLVYKFMSLASNKALWTGRAAFGKFGLSNILSDSSVGGYLAENPKLYPKLYRYLFDPNLNVRSSMKTIWDALVKDTSAVVDAHFDNIMGELLKSIMDGKEWRVREASSLAITHLIQGQPVEKYDKYLQDILTKAFKVLDDIKDSVRVAASKLSQTLTNVALHALETGDARSKRARLMLEHLIPFLMGPGGLESGSEEVQKFSMNTLMKIIKKCPKETLRIYAAPIMEKYLMSLSSLEPQIANYLHLNAEKYDMTSMDIDKIRLSSLRTSPVMEVIENYLLDALLHPDTIGQAADTMQSVIRSAIGMPSKVACANTLITMCRAPIVFQPYADRFLRLVKTQVFDRDQNVSAMYCVAVGRLARLASDPQLVKLMEWTTDLYFTSEQENSRLIAGEILNAVSQHAADRVPLVQAAFLPLAFVGTHDTDSEVKGQFTKVWEAHVSGNRIVALYLNEILDLVSNNLASPQWAVKHTSALTIAGAVKALGKTIDPIKAERIWPHLRNALSGKTWEGKEKVLAGFSSFVEHSRTFWEKSDVASEMTVRQTPSSGAVTLY